MYSIKLADGTELTNLELNGNNFIPKTLDKTVFTGNLEQVTITDSDGNSEERVNQKVQFASIGETETFILMNKSTDEIANEELMLAIAELASMVVGGGV